MEGGTVQLMDEEGNIIAITNPHKDARANAVNGKPIKAELGLSQGQYIESNGQLYQIVQVPSEEAESSPTSSRQTVTISRPSAIASTHLSPSTTSLLTQTSLSSASDSAEIRSKRHELLSRRPSYRKILNELSPGLAAESGESTTKVELESADRPAASSPTTQIAANAVVTNSRIVGLSSPPSATGASVSPATSTTSGGMVAVQTASGQLTVIPASSLGLSTELSPPSPNTLVQYGGSSSSEGIVVSSSSADQVQNLSHSSIALPIGGQRVIMTSAGLQLASDADITGRLIEDTSRKREVRLFKNREAARECRRKKKEYVRCLENRVAVLENQNKALIEELKSLKDLYCNK